MEDKRDRILVADDEQEIRDVLRLCLEQEGYEVITARDGQEAAERADETIDLYILDVNMPILSGFAASLEIRKKYHAPVIFLTAYSGESDKAMGFAAGADDYMVKPFSNTELLLRIKALLRRVRDFSGTAWERENGVNNRKMREAAAAGGRMEGEEPSGIRYKELFLDRDSQLVRKGEETIPLTYTEYRILELLLTHRKKVFSVENLYQSVWEEEAVGDAAVMAHIKNLRKKLEDDTRNPRYIKTAWGKGYYAD